MVPFLLQPLSLLSSNYIVGPSHWSFRCLSTRMHRGIHYVPSYRSEFHRCVLNYKEDGDEDFHCCSMFGPLSHWWSHEFMIVISYLLHGIICISMFRQGSANLHGQLCSRYPQELSEDWGESRTDLRSFCWPNHGHCPWSSSSKSIVLLMWLDL